MNKIVYIDFDGTVSDCRIRLYKLFCELSKEDKISFDEYWDLKCNGVSQKQLLQQFFSYTEEKICFFQKAWLEKIEEPKRLSLDSPVAKAEVFLKWLGKFHYKRVLVTNRQSKANLIEQLSNYGWKSLFEDVLVTEQLKKKKELIQQYETKFEERICEKYYIGDMQEDIDCAYSVNAKMIIMRNTAKMGKIPDILKKGKIVMNFVEAQEIMEVDRKGELINEMEERRKNL